MLSKMSNDDAIAGEAKSFKDVMYNTTGGRLVMLGGIVLGLFLAYDIIRNYLVREPVVQK